MARSTLSMLSLWSTLLPVRASNDNRGGLNDSLPLHVRVTPQPKVNQWSHFRRHNRPILGIIIHHWLTLRLMHHNNCCDWPASGDAEPAQRRHGTPERRHARLHRGRDLRNAETPSAVLFIPEDAPFPSADSMVSKRPAGVKAVGRAESLRRLTGAAYTNQHRGLHHRQGCDILPIRCGPRRRIGKGA